jgi:hypothetical protein
MPVSHERCITADGLIRHAVYTGNAREKMPKTTVTLSTEQLERLNGYRRALAVKMNAEPSNADVIMMLLDSQGWPR